MGFREDFDKQVKVDFDTRMVNHTITFKHNDGMYRHWQCNAPGTYIDGFDVITWPGHLCYTGDLGTYVFSRTNDMIAFMDGSISNSNFGYVAEKCISEDRDGVKKYYRECYEEVLSDEIKHCEDQMVDEDDNEHLDERIAELEALQGQGDEGEELAMSALHESGLFDMVDVVPECRYYTFRFLFCMYALRWFCDKIKETTTC